MAVESIFRPGARVIVTGATGQDGHFLVPLLLERGAEVHAVVRDTERARALFGAAVVAHECDLANDWDPSPLLATLKPEVIFNLAGQSSVRESFNDPMLSWRLNAMTVASLLESMRKESPASRLYQASSSEMFGCPVGAEVVHDEQSVLQPVSPYAASKAAAHMLCHTYREAYALRVTCGILFNHESEFRGSQFLTGKIAAHVRRLRAGEQVEPLVVGNLDIRRDWGSAREFANGILMIADQIAVRSSRSGTTLADEAPNYRDYVLGTSALTSVRELVDAAFRIAGFPLVWNDGEARFADGRLAVRSDRALYRAAEPPAIQARPARAAEDLGWRCTPSVEPFLRDMILRPTG